MAGRARGLRSSDGLDTATDEYTYPATRSPHSRRCGRWLENRHPGADRRTRPHRPIASVRYAAPRPRRGQSLSEAEPIEWGSHRGYETDPAESRRRLVRPEAGRGVGRAARAMRALRLEVRG